MDSEVLSGSSAMLLCIGGPKDGQRVGMADKLPRLAVEVPSSTPGRLVVEMYDRHKVRVDGVTFEVLALDGMGIVDILSRLIEGYGKPIRKAGG